MARETTSAEWGPLALSSQLPQNRGHFQRHAAAKPRTPLGILSRATATAVALATFFVLMGTTGSAATARVPWTSNRVAGSPYPPSPYAVERMYPQVSFDHPVDLVFMPGSDEVVV